MIFDLFDLPVMWRLRIALVFSSIVARMYLSLSSYLYVKVSWNGSLLKCVQLKLYCSVFIYESFCRSVELALFTDVPE